MYVPCDASDCGNGITDSRQAGPVKAPSVKYTLPSRSEAEDESEAAEAQDEDQEEDMEDVLSASDSDKSAESAEDELSAKTRSRKRKRGADEALEEAYLEKVAREEEKAAKRAKQNDKKKNATDKEDRSDATENNDDSSSESSDRESPPPVHETRSKDAMAAELDKSNRTVFLGNVSNLAIKSKRAKKTLLAHVASFLKTLPPADKPHKIESIRFRSTAYSTSGIPRKAAYARKLVMDETTASTNAYVVFSTVLAAQKAPAALNGTIVLDRHLRVDSVAHPAPMDHKRCVFVGNLDFVDKEPESDDDDEDSDKKKKKKKKKNRQPADVEEGLWRTFNEHTGKNPSTQQNGEQRRGNVEYVRVVRDQATRVGKGFAYVQFYDPNCVEEALLLDGKKFPPMLPRKLRVTRAKKVTKKKMAPRSVVSSSSSVDRTLQGRAGKLLGKSGAAKLRESDIVFEGQRAVEGASSVKLKTKSRGAAKKKIKGKPKTRSARRAAAWRASGKNKK